MPGVRDKILINSNGTEGNHQSIAARYRTLDVLSQEIVEKGLLVEAEPIKVKMQEACTAHDRADKKYINALDTMIADMAALIDKNL
jgi:hypothetical protein